MLESSIEQSFHHMTLPAAVLGNYVLFSLRYFVMAGSAYGILWFLKRDAFAGARIAPQLPPKSIMIKEVGWSLLSILVFSLLAIPVLTLYRRGWSHYYFSIDQYGWPYLIGTVIGLIVAHDTYFYWCHRLMHWPPLYKRIHAVHHRFVTPSPMAAFAFHPGEAFLEAIVFSIIPLFVPLHPFAIVTALTFMTTMNIIGHLGYEFYPKGFTRHWFGKWNNSATHHAMHHRFSRCNYGLYFNLWDRLCGTNHPRYDDYFDRIVEKRQSKAPVVLERESSKKAS